MRTILTTAAVAAFIVSSTAVVAQTQPPRPERPTTGDCVSDGFLGNEPNIVGPAAPGGPSEQEPGTKGGRVVPTQSPGPKVNNPLDPENPRRGASVGEVNQAFRTGTTPTGFDTRGARNLPQFCKTVTDAQQPPREQPPRN